MSPARTTLGKLFKLPFSSHTLKVLPGSSFPGETSLVWFFTILIHGSVLQRKVGPYPAIWFQFIEVNHRTFLLPMTDLGIDMSVLAGGKFCWVFLEKFYSLSQEGKDVMVLLSLAIAGSGCCTWNGCSHLSIRLWMKSIHGRRESKRQLEDCPT